MIDICLLNWKTEYSSDQDQMDKFQENAIYRDGILDSFEDPSIFLREPPTGLMILASILENRGYSVDIIDCTILYDPEQYIRENSKKYRLMDFTALTNTVSRVFTLSKIAKKANPDIYIVFGGPHVSFEFESILKAHRFIDVICIGESENSFPWFVDLLLKKPAIDFLYDGKSSDLEKTKNKSGKVNNLLKNLIKLPKGLSFRNGEQIINTGFPDATNLLNIPLPARHLISKVYNVADIIVNRGCPNKCSFCSRTKLFPVMRVRPLEQIIKEIDFITSSGNYKFINFYDNINVYHKFFNNFLDNLIARKNPLPWGAELRADIITKDEAEKLKRSNCKIIATGVESASEEVLKINFKFQDPTKVAEGIKRIKDVNVAVQAYFVIGLPGDNPNRFDKTLEYLKNLNLEADVDHVNFFVATPYPGCELVLNSEHFGIKIINQDYDLYDCREILMTTPSLNVQQISTMIDKAERLKIELKL